MIPCLLDGLDLAYDTDQLADDFDPVGGHAANVVQWIGRQQFGTIAGQAQPFERNFVLDAQREHIVLVGFALTFDHRDIAVGNGIAAHAVADDANADDFTATEVIVADLETFARFVEHRQRRAGRYLRHQVEAAFETIRLVHGMIF